METIIAKIRHDVDSENENKSIEEIKEMPKEIRFKFSSDFKAYNNIYKILLKQFKENVVL